LAYGRTVEEPAIWTWSRAAAEPTAAAIAMAAIAVESMYFFIWAYSRSEFGEGASWHPVRGLTEPLLQLDDSFMSLR
jgi:hypothetical protein